MTTLDELVSIQRDFDSRRAGDYAWDQEISESDLRPLLHNAVALAGEVGELCNLVKKCDRGDMTLAKFREEAAPELADVFIYLLKLSYQLDVPLEPAFMSKLQLNLARFPESVQRNESAGSGNSPIQLEEPVAPEVKEYLRNIATLELAELRDRVCLAARRMKPSALALLQQKLNLKEYSSAQVAIGAALGLLYAHDGSTLTPARSAGVRELLAQMSAEHSLPFSFVLAFSQDAELVAQALGVER